MPNFDAFFKALTGNPPFPWQQALYQRFIADRPDNIPASCNLPTGLGKTSVIAVWLIALANGANVPRRLVYVVNRRTVVDQTTDEVEKYRSLLGGVGPVWPEELRGLAERLAALSSDPACGPLAVSTLRGQFADNREWSADPSRPAVICGTVDMIGSRLLFSAYGVGMKGKPLHAGFLGQDALLVHDEAHLEPAFQTLLLAIENEQKRERKDKPALPWSQLRVMELTATPRSEGEVFELTKAEREIPPDWEKRPKEPIRHVWQRLKSRKALGFQSAKRDAVAKTIGETARSKWAESGKAVLVFVRYVDDVKTVCAALTDKKNGGVEADQVQLLTGTLRGLERDRLATTDEVFARFTPEPKVTPKDGTVYLVCTSAGEVGVDISADHMVSDLTTLDSMAQRFGRVNRRGEGAAEIDVVYESDPEAKKAEDPFELARWKSKEVLERLPKNERHDASPSALGVVMKALTKQERDGAFAPTPVILTATDILFDAWALTTIKDKLPGRPKVEPYLHGIAEWQPPETHVAWREEVDALQPKYANDQERAENEANDRRMVAKVAEEFLENVPLKPHELLKDNMTRVRERIDDIGARHPNAPAWVVDEDGKVLVTTLDALTKTEKREGKSVYAIDSRYATIVLPPSVGGLANGMLTGGPNTTADDVSCKLFVDKERTEPVRARQEDDDEPPAKMRLVMPLTLPSGGGDDAAPVKWYWFARPKFADDDGSKSFRQPITWQHHTDDVTHALVAIAKVLFPNDEALQSALKLAAEWHDLGKKRAVWQRSIGNPNPTDWHAKSGRDPKTGRKWTPLDITEYRHEFGSLLDVDQEVKGEHRDLILHLIAAHHGRARPHFPPDEAFDPERPQSAADDMAVSVPRRFAQLQRKYGRWGLAYLESLLRAADWAASANPSKFVEGDQ
ncbi:MAG: type I-G CRISPR-associated helicase/endonuclease Cas3g [Armatimonadaceae bacterium]